MAIAAELFATRGFTATTVREIAESAGILSGSLYHHFDSKEAMVDEILRDYLETQRRAFRRVVDNESEPEAAVTELIRESFAALHRHRWAVAIMHNEEGYLGGFERFDYLRAASGEFERIWIRVLRQGQQAGVFRPDLNPRLAHRFIRDSVAATVRWYNPGGRLSVRAIAEQYARIFCDGLVMPESRAARTSGL